jgi:hypothetical protein
MFDEQDHPLSDRLTVFIDFLGFEEATLGWDRSRTALLLEVLGQIAGLRSDFIVEKAEVPGGGESFDVRPAVTTFSDHIVLSYHLESEPFAGTGGVDLALSMAQALVANIAMRCLTLGLLIRGGATIGPLHHAHNVVFGPAMVEAYQLEASVATYPRIAVSGKLYGRLVTEPKTGLVLVDADGIRHLEYFTHMLWAAGGASGEQFVGRLQRWSDTVARNMAATIKKLESQERWRELSKWVWFERHFAGARGALPRELIDRVP